MAEIVRDHAPTLKASGFRKRRHCFNRRVQDGIVHVVNFWMAPKEPPAWTEVPGLRERRYGSFRLDFGVYVPEMTRSHQPDGDWINDYDCDLRKTIGELLGAPSDVWWRLDVPTTSETAGTALVEYGLPWLDSLSTRDSIIKAVELAGPLASGLGTRALIAVQLDRDQRPASGVGNGDVRRGYQRRILDRHALLRLRRERVEHLLGVSAHNDGETSGLTKTHRPRFGKPPIILNEPVTSPRHSGLASPPTRPTNSASRAHTCSRTDPTRPARLLTYRIYRWGRDAGSAPAVPPFTVRLASTRDRTNGRTGRRPGHLGERGRWKGQGTGGSCRRESRA
jgi:Domain of unknown function (DUF4304)